MSESLVQLKKLTREAAALLRDNQLSLEAGNLERLCGVELKKIEVRSERLESLVSRAFERFTDNDMQPPNRLLAQWLEDAKEVLA